MNTYTIYELSDPDDEFGTPSYIGWGEGDKPWTRRLENRVAKWVNDLGSPAAVRAKATVGTIREASSLTRWLVERVVRIVGKHPEWLLNAKKGYEKRRVYRRRDGKTESWRSLLEANRATSRDRGWIRRLCESNGIDYEGWTWHFE